MKFILNAIKLVIVSILAIFYWPINKFFMYFQKHYRSWKRDDMVSYIIATPLYFLLFIIASLISIPLETIATGMHPPLEKFK